MPEVNTEYPSIPVVEDVGVVGKLPGPIHQEPHKLMQCELDALLRGAVAVAVVAAAVVAAAAVATAVVALAVAVDVTVAVDAVGLSLARMILLPDAAHVLIGT